MNTKITIKAALDIWSRKVESEHTPDSHIAPADLYELVIREPSDDIQESLLDHLSRCSLCVRELKDMADSVKEAEMWDFAMPRAAASDQIRWPKEIPTEGGRYTIEIRSSIAEDDTGLVTVHVQPGYVEKLEGKQVRVKDGVGQTLLRGVVIGGKVSQQIDNLAKLDPQFTVEPD